MFAGKKVLHNGRVWCSVADAARYLRTTHQKVRNMMGAELDNTQIRKNGNQYVSLDDVVKVQIAKVYRAAENRKSRSGPSPRR
jgi:hypothetical protein